MFSDDIKVRAMVACGRHCCICHKFCGNNMEVHHIKAKTDGGSDTFDNAIPLCFDCHAEVRQYDPKHPKGIKFSERELCAHRDAWYQKVKSAEIPDKDEKNSVTPGIYLKNPDAKIEMQQINSGKELVNMVNHVYGIQYDYDDTEDEVILGTLCGFFQNVEDLVDVADDLDIPTKIQMGTFLNSFFNDFRTYGYSVFAARIIAETRGGKHSPSDFPILILHIRKNKLNTKCNKATINGATYNETSI